MTRPRAAARRGGAVANARALPPVGSARCARHGVCLPAPRTRRSPSPLARLRLRLGPGYTGGPRLAAETGRVRRLEGVSLWSRLPDLAPRRDRREHGRLGAADTAHSTVAQTIPGVIAIPRGRSRSSRRREQVVPLGRSRRGPVCPTVDTCLRTTP